MGKKGGGKDSLLINLMSVFLCASCAVIGTVGATSSTQQTITLEEHGDLKLVDNGYEGLVIAISDEIAQDDCNNLITGLQNLLREFSLSLWEATEGRAYLREATLIVPKTWHTNSLTCSLIQPLVGDVPISQPHIHITKPHPLFGGSPLAQQSQGCGRPGNFVQVGTDVLRLAANNNLACAVRSMVAEWAKFRWGVFEERGHSGDPLYPPCFRHPDTNQVEATACFDAKDRSNAPECEAAMPTFKFRPELYSNSAFTTSILSYPEVNSVRKFCNETTHNQLAPTKHNNLCGGRSAWEIIKQTVDFAWGRNHPVNKTKPGDPSLKFIKEGSKKYVLVVEDTATMNLQRRWEFLRKAIRRVVVYDVPDKSYIGIVSFNSVARTVAKLTYMESEESDMRQRVGSALPRNPSSIQESNKCILCGLQEAIRALNEASSSAAGATIILVTSGSGTSTQNQMDEMVRLIKDRRLQIMLVLYPLTERPGSFDTPVPHGLEPLVQSTLGSRTFAVMDEGVGNDSKVSMLMALMDSLLAAVRLSGSPDIIGAPVLIHSQSYPGGIASMSEGTFALDESLGPNARFSVYYYDLNHVGNAIQLTSPSGSRIVPPQEEDGDVNMIFVKLEQAERGLWAYKVENRADSHQGLYVQVTAKRNSSSGVSVRLWTNSGSGIINASNPFTPVVLYAQVTYNKAIVLDAEVRAVLHRLGTNATGISYEPITIDLRDNGVGDPDITKDDGIYSRYLPQLHKFPGRYLLSADVTHNGGRAFVVKEPAARHHKFIAHLGYPLPQHDICRSDRHCCGSGLSHVQKRRAAPFHHQLTWGVLTVVDPAPLHDLSPPSRIMDLRAEINDTFHEVILRWTAPGDDYDHGLADQYEAVVAPSWRRARAFQGNPLDRLPKPQMAGTKQETILLFSRFEEVWYVTIRAVDKAGNKGGVGNIAALWVPRPPTTYEITTRMQPGLTTSGNITVSQELGVSRPMDGMELGFEDFAVILGSIGGFLLIVLVLLAFCLCHSKRRRNKKEHKELEKGRSESVIVKSSSCSGGLDEGGDSMDSAVKDNDIGQARPLSPVHSWGATTLLQEHERRLSVHSNSHVPEDSLHGYHPDPPSNFGTPYPDVTVTERHGCAPHVSSPTKNVQMVHEPPPYDPPPYSTYAQDDPSLQCPCKPGPDYTSYAAAWDEPLTGHLLNCSRNTGSMTPTSNSLADRKRRNVTQV